MQIKLKGGEVYEVDPVDIRMWGQEFPHVDVEQALRSMAAWCSANPKKRKTQRGVRRFIVSWLMREADKQKPKERGVYAAAHKPFESETMRKGDRAKGMAALAALKAGMRR